MPVLRNPIARIVLCLGAGLPLAAHQPHDAMTAVAVSPNYAVDHTVLAGTAQLSIKINACLLLKSTDGGITWAPVSSLNNNTAISAIVFSPTYAQDQTVFVAGNGGLFRSGNQGVTWKQVNVKPVQKLSLSPNFATDNTLYAVSTSKTIYKSSNRGNTLTPVTTPSPLSSILSFVALSPNFTADHKILVGSQANGIFLSNDAGNTWAQVTANLTLPSVDAINFSPNYLTDQAIYAGTLGAGLLFSSDGGNTWNASNTGTTDLNVSSIAFSPAFSQDSTLWITTGVAGVFQSLDRGVTWTLFAAVTRALSGQSPVHYQQLATGPGASAADMYLAMYEGLWTGSSTVHTWRYVDTVPTRLVRYINVSPNYVHDLTVFCNTYGGGNVWSVDGGTTWSFQNSGMLSAYTDAGGFSPNYANDDGLQHHG